MALQKVTMKPGINRQASQTLGEGGWYDSSRVRFRFGMPQKLGGWVKWMASTLLGLCRGIHVWNQLNSLTDVCFATTDHVYVAQLGTLYDVTPIDRQLAVNANQITATSGQLLMACNTAASHGLSVGDYVTFDNVGTASAPTVARTPSGITVGGVTLSGDYLVTVIGSSTQFYFVTPQATSSATYAGTATVTCYLPTGRANVVQGTGWGAGGYGGAQSDGSSTGWGVAAPTGLTLLPSRQWMLDHWGEALVAAPTQGALYSWSPTGGAVAARLAKVTNSGTPAYGPPQAIGGGFVAMPERHLILLGCSDLNGAGNYDPMLLRWSDKEDFTSWFALATNAAGSARLQGGSQLVAGYNAQGQSLIWSDTSAFTMRFVGLPYVYRIDALGQNCGLVGPRAFAALGGIVYWMSSKAFFRFRGGAPELMHCTLWDDVIGGLNQLQAPKVHCRTTAAYGEVTWHYPSVGSTECDRYITYNTIEDVWYGGALARTAGVDAGPLTNPLATSTTGAIYAHESGVDDDGQAMGEFLLSGYIDIADGEEIAFVRGFLPDFQGLAGTVNVTLQAAMYPTDTPRSKGPFSITTASRSVSSRLRGRQIALRIDGGGVGSNWRLGALRADIQPDGSR